MTNYRTVIPGMGESGDQTTINHGQQGQRSSNYGGERSNQGAQNGTRVPGMNPENHTNSEYTPSGKPIVGFLISVSRIEEGEYWVLRQGQNVIGSGDNCNIVLSESSISGIHAVLAIHRNPNDGNRINVGIMDRGSSNGTFVNEEYIGFNPCQCKNLDKIKIGNYEMLLMLFDAVDYNMKKSDAFISKEEYDYDDRDMYSMNDGTKF